MISLIFAFAILPSAFFELFPIPAPAIPEIAQFREMRDSNSWRKIS